MPPTVDQNGYGLRVPGLVISPYAKKGYIDSQMLSFDAYLKFIEDDFLNGSRLDPKMDGRPDPRPTVRENVPILERVQEGSGSRLTESREKDGSTMIKYRRKEEKRASIQERLGR